MNSVAITGRATRDPIVRTSNDMTITRFILAVDRRGKKDEADFISCVAFGKTAEVIGKYIHKGSQMGIIGHINTGSYMQDNVKVYTTDVIVDSMDFLGGKAEESKPAEKHGVGGVEGWMNIPDGDETELPFQ